MSKLLTNGCSLTWGSGLNPDTRVVDAYPYKLAKLLDVELIDLSKPGESCQYVVRTTIDFFLERLNEDLSDYIVFLQMPSGLRFEYWKEDGWNSYMINNSDSKTIVNLFGNDMYDSYNMINSIMQVGSFLKENNINGDDISVVCYYENPKLKYDRDKKSYWKYFWKNPFNFPKKSNPFDPIENIFRTMPTRR